MAKRIVIFRKRSTRAEFLDASFLLWSRDIPNMGVVRRKGNVNRANTMGKGMGMLKSLHIVNLHRVVTMLKLKINVNLPQLLCIVVSPTQNGSFNFERFDGFFVDCYYTL